MKITNSQPKADRPLDEKLKNLREYSSVTKRREGLEEELNVSFQNIGQYSLDESVASTRNCENMIGVAQVPMGVAGPLRMSNIKYQMSNVYIPLATTEGALVASVNRGCKAISESGGALVDSYRVGTTRGPVFKVANLEESNRLNAFLTDELPQLQTISRETSQHITLIKIFSRGVGRYRFVRLIFDTQDAMGMNMVTVATEKLAHFISGKTGAVCLSIAGNYDVDKKPSWLNFIEGRGIKVWAEATISHEILHTILKTDAKSIYDTWLAKCMIGSAMSGSMGYNAHFANVIAALFIATGQDPAHVVEGSLGMTTTEIVHEDAVILASEERTRPESFSSDPGQARMTKNGDLYISIYLPDLMVGTIGGGTALATQKEALQLLGIAGGNQGQNSLQFAEIVGAAVLAGELSLLASLSAGSLGQAHERLGRGR